MYMPGAWRCYPLNARYYGICPCGCIGWAVLSVKCPYNTYGGIVTRLWGRTLTIKYVVKSIKKMPVFLMAKNHVFNTNVQPVGQYMPRGWVYYLVFK